MVRRCSWGRGEVDSVWQAAHAAPPGRRGVQSSGHFVIAERGIVRHCGVYEFNREDPGLVAKSARRLWSWQTYLR